MSRFLIVYTSTTGNTELMAEAMEGYLQELKHDVVSKHFEYDRLKIEELLAYDAILIGTYTWDDGEIPFEVEDFYDELEEGDLSDQLAAVFGSGDSFYDEFCMAVDLMEERLIEAGAAVMPTKIKVDLEPENDDIDRCKELIDEMVAVLAETKQAI